MSGSIEPYGEVVQSRTCTCQCASECGELLSQRVSEYLSICLSIYLHMCAYVSKYVIHPIYLVGQLIGETPIFPGQGLLSLPLLVSAMLW